MKKLTLALAASIFAHAAVTTAFAGISYWDPNGATVVTTGVVNETWENSVWAPTATPTASTAAFNEGDLPGFIANSGALVINATYNVTANANHTVGGLFNGLLTDGCVTNLQIGGTGIINIASGVQGFEVGTSGNMTVNGELGGTGTLEWQGGGGSLYLYGNNTYSGGTYLKTANGLNFNNNNSFGTGLISNEVSTTVLATPVNDGGGNPTGASSAFTIANDMWSYSGGSGTIILVGNTNAAITWTGNWHLSGASGTVTFDQRSGTVNITGAISGAQAFTKKNATGTLILSGANTYTGATTVSSGTLVQGVANAIPSGAGTGTMAVASGATFDLGGFDSTLNGFGTSAGFIDNTGAGAVVLTVGNNNGSGTHSGVIKNTGGVLSLSKVGTGTITISAANTFTGKTSVTGGALALNTSGDACLGTAPGSVVADQLTLDGGTLRVGTSANITLNPNRGVTLGAGGGTIDLQTTSTAKALDIQGPITGAGSLTKIGNQTLTLEAANTFTGGLILQQGRINLNNNNAAGTADIAINPTIVGSGTCTLAATNPAAVISIANNITLANTGLIDIIGVNAGANLTLNGVISGNSGFYRGNGGGAGVVVLNGANTFTGGVTNVQGGLVLGNKNALGTGTFVVAANSLGVTTVPQISANTDLTGANAIANAVNLNAGTAGSSVVFFGANNLEFSGPVTLGTSPNITNISSAVTTLAGGISGAFGLNLYGTGTTKITGTCSYSGATTVNGGALQVDGNITSSSGVTVSGGILKGNGSVPATIINSGGAVSAGASPGTLTSGAMTWNAGGTNVVEINDFSGTAGSNPGWDLINADSLTIASGPFTIAVSSLTGLSAGDAASFNNGQDYDLTIVHTTSGITGNVGDLAIDASGFSNALGTSGGFFQLAIVGNDLVLQYRRAAVATAVTPSTQTVVAGTTINMSITGTGSGTVTYQWYRGATALADGDLGGRVSGATTGALTISNTQTSDSDTVYHCTVTGINATTSDSGNATLAVVVAPVITSPAAASTSVVDAGTTQNLSVTVSDPNAVTYQWKKGGVNISDGAFDNRSTITGSATASLTLANVLGADMGDYTCVVQNLAGSATSLAQTLAVNDPVIVQQPVDSTFECGTSNALTVTAVGSTNVNGVLLYQWYKGDTNSSTALTDQTNSVLSFAAASVANAGSYFVVVTNGLNNSITSAVAVVTIGDTTVPVVTVTGSDQTIECHGGYTDAGATATDSCDGALSVSTSGLVDANTLGAYTLTYTATDSHNNVGSATRTVTVQDSTVPVVTINGSDPLTVECHGSFSDPGATASDVCSGDISGSITVSGLVNTNAVGSYTLTYTATDGSGNTAGATRVVNVSDTQAPVVTLTGSANMTVECHGSFADPGATANDACEGPVNVNTSGTVDANTTGAYTLTYTACDSLSHCSSVTRVVTVSDSGLPVVTLNGSSSMTVECHGSFADPGATASDDCDTSATLSTNGTINVNMVGNYTLTYTATDASGNTGSATREVVVNDTAAPVVTATGGDLTVECHTAFTDPGATADDACTGDATSGITSSGIVDTNTVGSYTLTYVVTDASGNIGSGTRTVTVNDITAPVVSVTGDNPQDVCLNSTFADEGATASDTCAGSLTATLTSGGVDTSTLGSYTVTYSSTDPSGNIGSATRVVNVIDCGITIVTQPAGASKQPEGTNVTLSVSATTLVGTLTYQWYENGSAIINATDASYEFTAHTNLTTGTNLIYYVVLGNGQTTVPSANALVTVIKDKGKPSLTIVSPANHGRAQSFTLLAKANAPAGSNVKSLKYFWTGGSVLGSDSQVYSNNLSNIGPAPNNRDFRTGGILLTNPPSAGTNTLTLWVEDLAGVPSSIQTRSLFWQVPHTYSLTIAGDGTGSVITKTKGGPGEVVQGAPVGTVGGGVTSNLTVYAFQVYSLKFIADHKADLPTPNVSVASVVSNAIPTQPVGTSSNSPVTVTFRADDADGGATVYFNRDRFVDMAGNYNAVFTGDPVNPSKENSRFLHMTVSKSRVVTGYLLNSVNQKQSFMKTTFSADGSATIVAGDITINGSLAWTGSEDLTGVKQFTGSATDGNFTAGVTADKEDKTAAPTLGLATIQIPGVAGVPGGSGFATVKGKNGSIAATYTLADDDKHALLSTGSSSRSGNVPQWIVNLKSGSLLFGNLNVADGLTNVSANSLSWIRPPTGNTVYSSSYPLGFTNAQFSAVCSPFSIAPSTFAGTFHVTTLGGAISNVDEVVTFAAGKATPVGLVTAGLVDGNGKLKLQFMDGGALKHKTTAVGTILQNTTNGVGFYIQAGATDAGSVTLTPQ